MKPKLFEYTLNNVDFFYSKNFGKRATEAFMRKVFGDSSLKLGKDYFKDIIEDTLNDFLPSKTKELIDLYSEKNGLERIAILCADGDSVNHKWYYFDGNNNFLVQNWVNKMDGKYKLLILKVCNEEGKEVSSKKSIICFPNEVYSVANHKKGRVQVELFVPEIGYVDNYIIDDEIKKLKE